MGTRHRTKLQLLFQQVIWKCYELEDEQDIKEVKRNQLYHKEKSTLNRKQNYKAN